MSDGAVIDRDGVAVLLAPSRTTGTASWVRPSRNGAIVHADIATVDDLPVGWTQEQDGGRCRLVRRGDDALFGDAVGPHSWKQTAVASRLEGRRSLGPVAQDGRACDVRLCL